MNGKKQETTRSAASFRQTILVGRVRMDDDTRSISSTSLERRSDRHVGPDPSEEDRDPRIDIFPRGIDPEEVFLCASHLSLSDDSSVGGVRSRAHDRVPQRKRRVAVPGKRSCVSQPNHS